MHLLSALAAGVRGAENGSVVLYKRGTTTKATYYDDFEGTTAKTQSASTELALDGNGRLEAYVNEIVDVVVKDSSGNSVITFTDGGAAPAVEVKSASFTGVDYVTAASAEGNPTTLQAALDLWKTNAGSADFKIQGATPTQLYNQTYTQAENVKRHGALGDNVADDTSAITAAITALGSGGGIVYFPPGTYRVTSTLSVPQNVSFVGTGPDSCAITMDHASNDLINTSGSSTYYYSEIKGLRLTASQDNTGNAIEIASAVRMRVDNCFIGGVNSLGLLINGSSASSELVCVDTHFQPGAATTSCINMGQATSKSHVIRCWFELQASHSATVLTANDVYVAHCSFNTTEQSVSSLTYLSFTGNAWIVGNRFVDPGVGTVTPIFQGAMDSDDEVHESGNNYDGNLTPFSYTSGDGARQTYEVRENNRTLITDNSATVTLKADQYGIVILKRTLDQAQTISANTAPKGARLILMVWWAVAGTTNVPLFDGSSFRHVTAISLTNGSADIRWFVSEDFGGTLKWTQVSDRISVTV